jgi:hypothetical protein
VTLLRRIPESGSRKPGICHSAEQDFVKKYSNFDPKKQGVLVTKGSFGRKNGDFCSFW